MVDRQWIIQKSMKMSVKYIPRLFLCATFSEEQLESMVHIKYESQSNDSLRTWRVVAPCRKTGTNFEHMQFCGNFRTFSLTCLLHIRPPTCEPSNLMRTYRYARSRSN
ncbi:hypothetical protein KIN20_033799 [Parelaphostrongylus tenuis]|uniref:Uncharacterized protein n=1 Tax=Parelaphostrongylus tenuis TaxID=148309 RepID=A0AAD5R967_PARTN|nr:hypothetical protein KIN20_033799 [Parelaphostrongylus tenuis]